MVLVETPNERHIRLETNNYVTDTSFPLKKPNLVLENECGNIHMWSHLSNIPKQQMDNSAILKGKIIVLKKGKKLQNAHPCSSQ